MGLPWLLGIRGHLSPRVHFWPNPDGANVSGQVPLVGQTGHRRSSQVCPLPIDGPSQVLLMGCATYPWIVNGGRWDAWVACSSQRTFFILVGYDRPRASWDPKETLLGQNLVSLLCRLPVS